MKWLSKLFGWGEDVGSSPGDATGPSGGADTFAQLAWLEPGDNPFGVRVLDCRPVARMISMTGNPASIRFLGSARARSGEEFRGQRPEEAIRVPCDLVIA